MLRIRRLEPSDWAEMGFASWSRLKQSSRQLSTFVQPARELEETLSRVFTWGGESGIYKISENEWGFTFKDSLERTIKKGGFTSYEFARAAFQESQSDYLSPEVCKALELCNEVMYSSEMDQASKSKALGDLKSLLRQVACKKDDVFLNATEAGKLGPQDLIMRDKALVESSREWLERWLEDSDARVASFLAAKIRQSISDPRVMERTYKTAVGNLGNSAFDVDDINLWFIEELADEGGLWFIAHKKELGNLFFDAKEGLERKGHHLAGEERVDAVETLLVVKDRLRTGFTGLEELFAISESILSADADLLAPEFQTHPWKLSEHEHKKDTYLQTGAANAILEQLRQDDAQQWRKSMDKMAFSGEDFEKAYELVGDIDLKFGDEARSTMRSFSKYTKKHGVTLDSFIELVNALESHAKESLPVFGEFLGVGWLDQVDQIKLLYDLEAALVPEKIRLGIFKEQQEAPERLRLSRDTLMSKDELVSISGDRMLKEHVDLVESQASILCEAAPEGIPIITHKDNSVNIKWKYCGLDGKLYDSFESARLTWYSKDLVGGCGSHESEAQLWRTLRAFIVSNSRGELHKAHDAILPTSAVLALRACLNIVEAVDEKLMEKISRDSGHWSASLKTMSRIKSLEPWVKQSSQLITIERLMAMETIHKTCVELERQLESVQVEVPSRESLRREGRQDDSQPILRRSTIALTLPEFDDTVNRFPTFGQFNQVVKSAGGSAEEDWVSRSVYVTHLPTMFSDSDVQSVVEKNFGPVENVNVMYERTIRQKNVHSKLANVQSYSQLQKLRRALLSDLDPKRADKEAKSLRKKMVEASSHNYAYSDGIVHDSMPGSKEEFHAAHKSIARRVAAVNDECLFFVRRALDLTWELEKSWNKVMLASKLEKALVIPFRKKYLKDIPRSLRDNVTAEIDLRNKSLTELSSEILLATDNLKGTLEVMNDLSSRLKASVMEASRLWESHQDTFYDPNYSQDHVKDHTMPEWPSTAEDFALAGDEGLHQISSEESEKAMISYNKVKDAVLWADTLLRVAATSLESAQTEKDMLIHCIREAERRNRLVSVPLLLPDGKKNVEDIDGSQDFVNIGPLAPTNKGNKAVLSLALLDQDEEEEDGEIGDDADDHDNGLDLGAFSTVDDGYPGVEANTVGPYFDQDHDMFNNKFQQERDGNLDGSDTEDDDHSEVLTKFRSWYNNLRAPNIAERLEKAQNWARAAREGKSSPMNQRSLESLLPDTEAYALVTFKSKEACDLALSDVVRGFGFTIGLPEYGQFQPSTHLDWSKSKKPLPCHFVARVAPASDCRTLVIRGIPVGCTKLEAVQLMNELLAPVLHGTSFNPPSGREFVSNGTCTITFRTHGESRAAYQILNGSMVQGQQLSVGWKEFVTRK